MTMHQNTNFASIWQLKDFSFDSHYMAGSKNGDKGASLEEFASIFSEAAPDHRLE